MSILICKECGFEIGEHTTETEKINKCPKCGSDNLSYLLCINDSLHMHESIRGKTNKMPGKKKPYQEFQHGVDYSKTLEKFVNKDRIIDRENDRYYEKVKDPDTGEVLHECHEKLSEHIGHGSAKK